MNTEEDEFRRIEREALRRAAKDEDDTQVYAKPWVGLTDEEVEHIADSEWEEAFVRLIEAKLKEKNT